MVNFFQIRFKIKNLIFQIKYRLNHKYKLSIKNINLISKNNFFTI